MNKYSELNLPVYRELFKTPQVFANFLLGHFQTAMHLGGIAIKGAFLLNATAGLAAFTKVTSSQTPILFCAIGAFLAVLTSGLAWIMQRRYLIFDSLFYSYIFLNSDVSKKMKDDLHKAKKRRDILTYACGISWGLSLLFFGLAIYNL